MADRGAVMRALQGAGGRGGMGGMDMEEGGAPGGMPDPRGAMPKPGQEGEGQDNPMDSEAIANGITGFGMYIQAESKKGNPDAQEAMGHFQALLRSVAKMSGGQAPGAPQDGAQQEDGFGVPKNVLPGSTPFGPQMGGPRRRPQAGVGAAPAVVI